MGIVQGLFGFAVRQLIDGACAAVGVREGGKAVVGFLNRHFTDHSQRLTNALQTAGDRTWKALEVALAGESLTSRLASTEDRVFREQVRAFLGVCPDGVPTVDAAFRQRCLRELRAARKAGKLSGEKPDPQALAHLAGEFARYNDPQAILDAERKLLKGLACEFASDYPDLARLLELEPQPSRSLLVVGVRYFFRRAVEEDQELFQGLAFAKLERLSEVQEQGFAALDSLLQQHGQRLETLLGELQTLVAETHDAVLDLQTQMEGQGEQVRQIGQAVQKLLEQHQLQRRELRPGDSLSIRNDNERQLVKQLVARYRALPDQDRNQVPALLNAIGKLEVVAGDFDAAQKDFQAVALLEQDNKAKAEAHYNAYLALLEKRDWPGAIQELVKAVKLDGKRFAPFPAGKYQPVRILGAGGFGVAFLCKHKYMDAQVVVKTLALEDLGRDADKVFTEAQVLRQLDHPAIIRMSDCGYFDAANRSRPFLVMDYFPPGITLEEHVKKHGPLAVDDLLAVARQVAEGLHAAHGKNILHRDVKPANLLVRKDAEGWQVKVIDFGLALRQKVVQKSTNASTGKRSKTLVGDSIAGTVDYAAPEQMGKRDAAVAAYSDVYGWAKTCCYALFQTTQPTLRHWQSVPGPLAELLGRCLEEDAKNRPQGFAEVVAALDTANADASRAMPNRCSAPGQAFDFGQEPEQTPRRRLEAGKCQRSGSRTPLLIGGGAALAVVVVAVVLGMVVLRSRTSAGTLVVEVDQPGAEVYVDGQRYTIARPGGKEPIQVEVQEGTRQLKVVKGGFETFTREFTVKSGGKESVRVRLKPVAVASTDTKPTPRPEKKNDPGEIKPSTPSQEKVQKLEQEGWTSLFNGKDLSNFYTYLGTPKSYPGPAVKGETRYGKNNDPEGVFSVHDGVIRVSGKVFGGFGTEKEYENYHLIVEYKWGNKTWPPREANARSSGILLHCNGEDGIHYGYWPDCIDCQLAEGMAGTLLLIPGKGQSSVTVEAVQHDGRFYFKPGSTATKLDNGRVYWYGHDPNWLDLKGYRGRQVMEKPVGEWNTIECACNNDNITVSLNGRAVNAVTKVSRTRGRIFFQSEGAEIFFRKIAIKKLTNEQGRRGSGGQREIEVKKLPLASPKGTKSILPIGTWVEARPDTPAGDRLREFRPDGTLIVYIPKSGETFRGAWKWGQGKVFLSADGKTPVEDRWFTIVGSNASSMTIMMMGRRRYTWTRSPRPIEAKR